MARAPGDLVDFIRTHGLVLESAKGPVGNLVAHIVGAPVSGNWWSHPQANAVYNALQEVRSSPDILTCRLVNGKVTLVHRRLWPALLNLSSRIDPSRLAAIAERHTPSGKHEVTRTPLAEWVGEDVRACASRLTTEEALRMLEAIAPLHSMLAE